MIWHRSPFIRLPPPTLPISHNLVKIQPNASEPFTISSTLPVHISTLPNAPAPFEVRLTP